MESTSPDPEHVRLRAELAEAKSGWARAKSEGALAQAQLEESRRRLVESEQLREEQTRLRRLADLLAATYKHRLDDLLRRLFGPASEKVDPQQLELAYEAVRDDETIAAVEAPEPPEPKPLPEGKSPRRGGGRRPAPQHLPVERVILDVPAAEREGCVRIREEVTEEIDYVPSRFIRRHYVRPVYARADKTTAPLIAVLPARVLPQSGVGVGLLAHVVVARYTDHLPFYRQEQIYARAGVEVARQKLSRWAEQVALLLQGLHGQLRQRILESGYCQADETPVKVLDAERPGAARDAWLWTYHAPHAQVIVFDFHESRGRDGPRAFIPEHWQGVLQTDGYELYRALCAERPRIVHAGCLAHARRKWIEATDGGGEVVAAVLADFATLYRVEAEARERKLSAAERAQLRQRRSELVLARLRQKMERARESALPQSRIGLAAHYALARWEVLTRYIQPGYGHVEIDNNPVENGIRPTALGKRNWLFIGHPDAGWKSAVLYSLLGTCKLLGVNPEHYLTWVLPQLAASTNHAAARGLLPHDYAATVKERSG
jgi:transposase